MGRARAVNTSMLPDWSRHRQIAEDLSSDFLRWTFKAISLPLPLKPLYSQIPINKTFKFETSGLIVRLSRKGSIILQLHRKRQINHAHARPFQTIFLGAVGLSEQCGSVGETLISSRLEPQIPSQAAVSVSLFQLVTLSDPAGRADLHPFPIVAAKRRGFAF